MPKFNRYHASAVRRAARNYLNDHTLVIEAGQRGNGSGGFTFDSTKWPKDEDLHDVWPINDVVEDLTPGFTFDLYIYEHPDIGGDILTNLDALWTGTDWQVFDPFADTRPRAVERPLRP